MLHSVLNGPAQFRGRNKIPQWHVKNCAGIPQWLHLRGNAL